MPATIGSLFRRIVKDLQAQASNPNSYLNNSNSDINNPSSDINNKDSCALQINQSFEVVAYLKRQLRNESELANNEPKGNS